MTEEKAPSGAADFSFGDELRKEREIRGISLGEIADATKISKRFLDAIERNDFRSLPAPVFTRGFVREYARYLGLNSEEIVDRYAHFVRLNQTEDDEPHPLVSSSVPDRKLPPRRSRMPLLIGGIVLALLLIVLAWMVWRARAPERKGPVGSVAPVDSTVLSQTASAQAPIPLPAPLEQDLTLVIEATRRVWIVAHADGQRVLHETLQGGERRTIQGRNSITLAEVGDAAALRLTLNGLALLPLGGDAVVVRNRVFDREFLNAERSRRRSYPDP